MADTNFTLDVTNVVAGFNKLDKLMQTQLKQKGAAAVGDELLRLSQSEVPFGVPHLANTGVSDVDGDEHVVGYNTPYAARLHENPQYNFKNGRKGKYLEQPIKENLSAFNKIFGMAINEGMK